MPFYKKDIQYLDQNVSIKDRQMGSPCSLRLKEQLIAAYKKGYKIEYICEKAHVSNTLLYSILAEAKVPMREAPTSPGVTKGPKPR